MKNRGSQSHLRAPERIKNQEPKHPMEPKYIISIQNNLVKGFIKNFSKKHKAPTPTKPKRGKIKEFSNKARKRLIEELLTIKSVNCFITLTYPEKFPTDPKTFKKHLDYFRKKVVYKFPNCYLTWKFEYQKRGAPHYHFLGSLGNIMRTKNGKIIKINYQDKNTIRYIQSWLSKTWFEIVKSQDPKHLKAGTRIDFIFNSSLKLIKKYIAKYISKPDTTQNNSIPFPGKFWGKFPKHNANLVKPPKIEIELHKPAFYSIRRILRQFIKSKKLLKIYKIMKKYPCFTIYINPKSAFILIINSLKITYEKLKHKEWWDLRYKIAFGELDASQPYKVAFTLEKADELNKLAKQILQKINEIKSIANHYLSLLSISFLN